MIRPRGMLQSKLLTASTLAVGVDVVEDAAAVGVAIGADRNGQSRDASGERGLGGVGDLAGGKSADDDEGESEDACDELHWGTFLVTFRVYFFRSCWTDQLK